MSWCFPGWSEVFPRQPGRASHAGHITLMLLTRR
jgi:hypothetical protein